MESDISEPIETAAPTDNEEEEEDSIPVESVDEEERFEDGDRDGEPVTIRFQMKYKYNKKHVVEAIEIETAAPTMNEGNEDLIVPVDIVVEEERFEDGDGVERNGMTTSDNPIDTGTTTTKAEAE